MFPCPLCPLCALSGKGAKCAWRSRLRIQLRMLQTRSWTLGSAARTIRDSYREPVQGTCTTRLDETRDSRLEARGLMAVLCTSDGPKPRHTVPPTFPRCSQPIVRTEPPSAQNLTEPGFCILLHLDHLVALLSL